jgi:hypothetical protein
VLDIEDAPPHLPERLAVADPLGVQNRVDGEAGVFGRGEEQLGGARELGFLDERAGAEERLVGGRLFGLDDERGRLARVLAGRRVSAAPEVVLQWLVAAGSVRRDDDQRVGLPVVLELGLGDAAAGRPSQQPLQLAGGGALEGDRPTDPVEGALLGRRQRLQLGAGDRSASSSTRRRTRAKERSAPGPPSASARETAT